MREMLGLITKIKRLLFVFYREIMRAIIGQFLYYLYQTPIIYGDKKRLNIGKKVCQGNTLYNLSSGDIWIGDYTIMSHNVMLITGKHEFRDGRRAGLLDAIHGDLWGGGSAEVKRTGRDIVIGSGTWICSGAIIIGNVRIGDNVIVAAGAVVTNDVEDYAVVAGVPARKISDTRKLNSPVLS